MENSQNHRFPSNLQITSNVNVTNSNLQPQQSQTGTVSGTVKRTNGTALRGALVQLYDSNGIPFRSANTNNAGRYIIPTVPIGSHSITATLSGFLTPARIPVTVTANRNTVIDITMQTNPDANKSAVNGTILNAANNENLSDTLVQLLRVSTTEDIVTGMVTTNAEGRYLFANLDNGTYYLTATKTGFLPKQSSTFTLSNRDYTPANITLEENPDADTGTVSGIISDGTTNQPLENAIVALYSLANETEELIDITKTNSEGLYLFGSIPVGTYRVKATVQVEVLAV